MTVCGDLVDPENGQIDYIGDERAPFNVDTIAMYSCDQGFELSGDYTMRRCVGDNSTRYGEWTGDPPTCVGELIYF